MAETSDIAKNCKLETNVREGEKIFLKLKRRLDICKTLMDDKQEMAIQGQALFDEVETDYQILDQELKTFMLHMKQL